MIFIAGILLEEGFKHVDEIRKALFAGALLFAIAGFAEGVWLAGEDMKAQLFNFLKIGVIASLIAGFPSIIQEGDKALDQVRSSIQQGQQDAFRAQIDADAAEPSWTDIPSRIAYTLGICLQKIGWVGYQLVYWVKDISILLLIAVSPLLLGFLALSHTKAIGINFLITSLTVILWNIGFAIVDTLLVVLGNIVMPIMGAGGAGLAAGLTVVTVGPQFLALCLVAAVLPIAMYCAVPIITGAIMRGTNVAGAAMAAYGMAHHATSHTGATAGVARLASTTSKSPPSTSLNGMESSSDYGSFPYGPSGGFSNGPFMNANDSADGGSTASRNENNNGGASSVDSLKTPSSASSSPAFSGSAAKISSTLPGNIAPDIVSFDAIEPLKTQQSSPFPE